MLLRGDVIVFDSPVTPGTLSLLRVLARAGERLQFKEDGMHLNREIVRIDGIRYEFRPKPVYGYGYEAEYTVPTDTVFVVGDNFSGALDSRTFGPVDAKRIIGRVKANQRAGQTDKN
jgi:signal peptidase I